MKTLLKIILDTILRIIVKLLIYAIVILCFAAFVWFLLSGDPSAFLPQ